MSNPRYIVTEIRDQNNNEFIFGVGERVVACSEISRLFNFLRDEGYQVERIDERSLPTDANSNTLVGYTIKKYKENENDDC